MAAARKEEYAMEAKDKHPEPRLNGTLSNDFSSPVYWDMRYQKQREREGPGYSFEWYCDLDMGSLVLAFVRTRHKCVDTRCRHQWRRICSLCSQTTTPLASWY